MKNKVLKLMDMRKRQLQYNEGIIIDLDQFFVDNVRQVKWLCNNANKCTKVIKECDAQIIIQRLKDKISELESHPVKMQRTGKI